MRVALVSLNQVWENKGENFQACRSFVQRAKAQGAELVIFSEMTLTAFSMNIRTVNY
jgi:predicted amidohydrolase